MVRSLLVITDTQARIDEVLWGSHSNVQVGQYVFEQFAKEAIAPIVSLVRSALARERFGPITAEIVDSEGRCPMDLRAVPVGQQVMVLVTPSGADSPGLPAVSATFVDTLCHLVLEITRAGDPSTERHLEEMQKLNNELINTRRQLEKANYQLNLTNQELQDSLVQDALTGLVGRYQYWQDLETAIHQHPDKLGVFAFLDLDDFKSINDRFGHNTGDRYLIAIAERLQQIPLPKAIKIRVAGDEFALFTYGLDAVDNTYLAHLWELITTWVLAEPVWLNGIAIPVRVSGGMAVFGEDAHTVSDLLEYADFAMYQAKRRGKNQFCRFQKEEYDTMGTPHVRRELLEELMISGQFFHVYQPIVSATDGEVHGYTALLQTASPHFPSTLDLLNAALEAGQYRELQRHHLSRLLEAVPTHDLQEAGQLLFVSLGPYPILSRQALTHLPMQKMSPLCLEVGDIQGAELDELKAFFDNCQQDGYQISVTNLGGGQTNDLLVLGLEPKYVKPSISLTSGIDRNPFHQHVVAKIIAYAHQQQTKVIVEGITTAQEMETIIRLGADFLQGNYIGQPASRPARLDPAIRSQIGKCKAT